MCTLYTVYRQKKANTNRPRFVLDDDLICNVHLNKHFTNTQREHFNYWDIHRHLFQKARGILHML